MNGIQFRRFHIPSSEAGRIVSGLGVDGRRFSCDNDYLFSAWHGAGQLYQFGKAKISCVPVTEAQDILPRKAR